MTRSGVDEEGHAADRRVRLVLAGAAGLDDLTDAVWAEVARAVPGDAGALRVGATSLMPRDEAARAARWVARVGSRRGLPTQLVGPTSATARSWPGALPWVGREGWEHGAEVSVGVARLDLSPVMAAVEQPYAVGVWLPLEPRRLRRLSSDADRQLIDAALDARPAATVLVGRDPEMAIALVGTDLLAVEVVGRALRAAAQLVGDLGLSPWEARVVQRGIELGAGAVHPDRIDLETVWLADPRDRAHDRFHRVAATATERAGIATRA